MVIELILIPLTIIVLLIASYADLKRREVPDWLSYGFLMAVLGIRAIFSVEQGWTILISGLLGLLVGFAIACLLYYTNQWGGGDSKLLMGMGALLGINIPLQSSSLNLFWFLLALLFLGAVYGLIWMLVVAMKYKHTFREQWVLTLRHSKRWQITIALFTLGLALLAVTYPFVWPIVPFPALVLYLFLFVNTVERGCFYIYRAPRQLVEGDWLAEEVRVGVRKVLPAKTLEKEDLLLLKNLEVEKKLKKVLIKEGVPFVPSFMLAYLAVLGGKWWVGWFVRVVLG